MVWRSASIDSKSVPNVPTAHDRSLAGRSCRLRKWSHPSRCGLRSGGLDLDSIDPPFRTPGPHAGILRRSARRSPARRIFSIFRPFASSSTSLSRYRVCRVSGVSMSSIRSPQMTPLMSGAFGLSVACLKNVSNVTSSSMSTWRRSSSPVRRPRAGSLGPTAPAAASSLAGARTGRRLNGGSASSTPRRLFASPCFTCDDGGAGSYWRTCATGRCRRVRRGAWSKSVDPRCSAGVPPSGGPFVRPGRPRGVHREDRFDIIGSTGYNL